MAVNIVTGMTGKAHITSDDDRAKNVLSFGTGKYVMDYGKKFETSILSNNQIRVRDGMCINQGTQMGIELNDYEDVTIENGVSGSNRNDLIVMRYERNEDTAIEKASLVVIKGTAGSTATDPSYNSGNILDGGDLIDDMPLFRVKIESLSITAVEPLFVVFDYSHRKALAGLSNVDNTSDLNKPLSIATQKAVDELNTGIQSVDKNVITNLLKPTLPTTTQNDVTCTNNGDGTYTLNGTASKETSFWILKNLDLNEGNYNLLGCPTGGSQSKYLLQLYGSGEPVLNILEKGLGKIFTLDKKTNIDGFIIRVYAGQTCNNLVFKPMITTNLNADYSMFVPYTGSTGQINSDVAKIVNNLGDASYKGVSTSVLSGDTNLVTGDAVSKAIYTATNYEEGEWTPKLSLTIDGTQYAPIRASAAYKRVGNIVHIRAYLSYDSPVPSASTLYLQGLPVAINPKNYAGSRLGNILIGQAIVNGITSKSFASGTGAISINLPSATPASEVTIDTIYWI